MQLDFRLRSGWPVRAVGGSQGPRPEGPLVQNRQHIGGPRMLPRVRSGEGKPWP